MAEGEKKAVKVEINLPESVASGRYANGVMVNFSATEFVIDFLFLQPQQPRADVVARVIMHPGHIARLRTVLQKQIERYESRFGKLPEPPSGSKPVTLH